MIDFNCTDGGAIILYECDPAKNTACMREWCAADHPDDPKRQCHRTMHPEFAKDGTPRVAVDIRTGKEKEV